MRRDQLYRISSALASIIGNIQANKQRDEAKTVYQDWLASTRKPTGQEIVPTGIGATGFTPVPQFPDLNTGSYVDLATRLGDNPYAKNYLDLARILVDAGDRRRAEAKEARKEKREEYQDKEMSQYRQAQIKNIENDNQAKALDQRRQGIAGLMQTHRINPAVQSVPEYPNLARTLYENYTYPETVTTKAPFVGPLPGDTEGAPRPQLESVSPFFVPKPPTPKFVGTQMYEDDQGPYMVGQDDTGNLIKIPVASESPYRVSTRPRDRKGKAPSAVDTLLDQMIQFSTTK